MSEEAFVYDITGLLKGLGVFRQPTGLVHLLQEIQLDGRYTYIYTNLYSYNSLAQVRDWTTEDGEGVQQAYYFHCDQIGIPRENFPEGDFLVGAHGNSSIVATNEPNQNLFTLR